ncbi:MAG: hypothetical protein Q4E28_01140 [Clostridia bacterium]|nr:hypothetical protein [Clostridia bacterium]
MKIKLFLIFISCFLLSAFCLYSLFENIYISLVGTIVCGILLMKSVVQTLHKKQQNVLRLQFVDFLDFINSSILAGNNTFISLHQVHNEMVRMHGDKSLIARESLKIKRGLDNSVTPEQLLTDMGNNCGVEEIEIFADAFHICNRNGGNIAKLIFDSKKVISEKIQTENEISTILASSKNEVYLLFIMPFIVSLAMKYLLNYTVDNMSLIVRIIAEIIFVFSFYIGQRITDFKI